MGQQDLHIACGHLLQGHVIAYPTEAVWGLGCDPDDRKAVVRLLAIKQRPIEKGLILVAGSLDQLGELLNPLKKSELDQLHATWPGPVTWLIPDTKRLIPSWIKGCHESVAIRVSAHPVVQALCLQFGKLLVSTSANEAGAPPVKSLADLKQRFADKIDYIIEGELGTSPAPTEIRDLQTGQVFR
ncbi:MAG: Sua5/YciO/YrdC/YwlC family protein [Proteobacteria bacterium]|nr:Sua5/YciO/YrdC/YwlC family protein [Pseudomonadota bacterium]